MQFSKAIFAFIKVILIIHVLLICTFFFLSPNGFDGFEGYLFTGMGIGWIVFFYCIYAQRKMALLSTLIVLPVLVLLAVLGGYSVADSAILIICSLGAAESVTIAALNMVLEKV